MKIKLDENITSELVSLLEAAGHDADTVLEEGINGHPDVAVWDATQKAARLLITQDLDFSDIRLFQPGEHYGLILLRLSHPSRKRQLDYFSGLLRQYDLNVWAGCHVVATDRKIRVRRPPA